MLSLHEELYILSIDDEKGAVVSSGSKALTFGLAGAVLTELALQNKVSVKDKGRLEVIDGGKTGDELLDGVLQEIQASEKPRKITYWVGEISATPKKLRKQLEGCLATKGVVEIDDGNAFLAIPSGAGSQPGFPTKYEIKNRLRAGILADEGTDLRSLALLGLARSSKLLKYIFTKDERRVARRRIHEKIVREALGNSVAETIEEIEAAISVCLTDASG